MAIVKRLSYAERQALEQQDAQFLPLAIIADLRSHHAHLRQMIRLLRNRQSSSPCSDLITYAASLYERTAAAIVPNFSASLACKAGCAYCCAQPVSVTLPEAIMVANAIRGRPETVAAVLESTRLMQERDPGRGGPWTVCPLLADKICSVYAARPFNCHSFISVDVNDCVKSFVLFGPNSVRGPLGAIETAQNCRLFLNATLKQCGKSYRVYELIAAVAAALVHEDAEVRWLRGEDIFANLQPLPDTRSQDQEDAVIRMATEVAPTL